MSNKRKIKSIFERFLTLWVGLCIVAGIVLGKLAPGLAEAMRIDSLKVTPHAMLSRAVAGIRGRVLIVNLPGSPKAARENLQVVLPVLEHAVQLLKEDSAAEDGHIPK